MLISRGGGNRLDVFDNMVVLKAIKHCRTPTFVAVGHAQDRTLADEVADHYAADTYCAGEYLADLGCMNCKKIQNWQNGRKNSKSLQSRKRATRKTNQRTASVY